MSREKKRMHVSYEVERKVLSGENIEEIIVSFPRKLRQSQVTSLYTTLKENEHFDTPIVVNRTYEEGKEIIDYIDGNHRKEAMKKYFMENPDKEIEVIYFVYDNLSKEEMKKVYSKWNKQVRQSPQDLINLYKNDIEQLQLILHNCKASIYASKGRKIPVHYLVDAYIYAKQGSDSPNSLNPFDRVEEMKEFTRIDTMILTQFSNFMQEVFNPSGAEKFADLPAFKTTLIKVMFRIWYRNHKRIPRKKLVRRIKSKIANDAVLLNTYSQGGNKIVVDAFDFFLKKLNDKLKTTMYI